MKNVVVGVFNPGEAPEHNGQTIHALKLARSLTEGGANVVLAFQGKAVTWIPRFVNRNEDSHPFVKHYGHVFDEVRGLVRACNMCCIRFDATDAVRAADVPIIGEGREHIDIARYVLEGYQVINF